MAKMQSGLNEHPGEGYNLASRFLCAKCGKEPRIKNASEIRGSEFTAVVECHGETESKHVTKKDLLFTQRCFE